MQQTPTYNLNLIETSDTFSPGPLNDNAQKVENALSAGLENARQERAALTASINDVNTSLSGSIHNVSTSLNASINNVSTSLNASINNVNTSLNAALSSEANTRAQADEGLNQRVAYLEGRIVTGTYTGNVASGATDKEGQHIHVGFTPALVIVGSGSDSQVISPERPYRAAYSSPVLVIEEGGFRAYLYSANVSFNTYNLKYAFVAFR